LIGLGQWQLKYRTTLVLVSTKKSQGRRVSPRIGEKGGSRYEKKDEGKGTELKKVSSKTKSNGRKIPGSENGVGAKHRSKPKLGTNGSVGRKERVVYRPKRELTKNGRAAPS